MARALAAILVLGFANTAASEKPVRAAQCAADADCTITTFSGCCGGCCPQARAMSKAELAQQQRRCAAVDCEAPMCAAVVCEPGPAADALVARCQAGRCVAEEKPPAGKAECASDRECTIVYPEPPANAACRTAPCGCCPGTTPVAVPVGRAEERRGAAAPAPQSPQQPKRYGLSQGDSAAPQPACSPCPGPAPAVAVCRQGRCSVAQPRP